MRGPSLRSVASCTPICVRALSSDARASVESLTRTARGRPKLFGAAGGAARAVSRDETAGIVSRTTAGTELESREVCAHDGRSHEAMHSKEYNSKSDVIILAPTEIDCGVDIGGNPG